MTCFSCEKGSNGIPRSGCKTQLDVHVHKKIKVLAMPFGGQGTINVTSWSPDSTKVAFVSYEYLVDTPRD